MAEREKKIAAKIVATDRAPRARKIAAARVRKVVAERAQKVADLAGTVATELHARTPHAKRALTRHTATNRAKHMLQDLTTSRNSTRVPSHTARAAPALGKNRKAHRKVCLALPGRRTRAPICPDANQVRHHARRTRRKQHRTLAKRARTHTRAHIHHTARSAGTQALTSQLTPASPVNRGRTNQAASHTRAAVQTPVQAKPVPAHHAAPSRLIGCSDMKNGPRDSTSRGPICVLQEN